MSNLDAMVEENKQLKTENIELAKTVALLIQVTSENKAEIEKVKGSTVELYTHCSHLLSDNKEIKEKLVSRIFELKGEMQSFREQFMS